MEDASDLDRSTRRHDDSPQDRYPSRNFSSIDNEFVSLSFHHLSRTSRDGEREREGGAVLIYTLLFPALVYNYAIFSQTSPYFFVPGDAPRSKSARHEGVVKSTRLVESRGEPKVSPGWWPFGRTLALLVSPDILSSCLSFFPFSFPRSSTPSRRPLFIRFADKAGGWPSTRWPKGNRIRTTRWNAAGLWTFFHLRCYRDIIFNSLSNSTPPFSRFFREDVDLEIDN